MVSVPDVRPELADLDAEVELSLELELELVVVPLVTLEVNVGFAEELGLAELELAVVLVTDVLDAFALDELELSVTVLVSASVLVAC